MTWEVDWSRTRMSGPNLQAWARNPDSLQAQAREWHWTTHCTLRAAGVKWQKKKCPAKSTDKYGYIKLFRAHMSAEDIAVSDRAGLWIGPKENKNIVMEHRLVAAKKYGTLPKGIVVRHVNGDKADNRPENLVLGTNSDNRKDHRDAVVEMIHWREKYNDLARKAIRLVLERRLS